MKSRKGVKVGLACAGGVVGGAIYEIGALCALEEAIDGICFHELDVYVGVSSGSVVTACLANGISAPVLSRAIISQADPVLNFTPDLLFTPAFKEYAVRFCRIPAVMIDAVRQYFLRPRDLSLVGMVAGLGSIMPVGLFDNEPLQRYLERVFSTEGRTDDFRALKTRLRVVSVNVDTAGTICFGDPATAHVPISRAVQASTALPALYCPVEIDGQYYIDGVTRKTVHASVALREGSDLLFCVNPIVPVELSAQDREGHSLVEYGLPTVLSQTFRTIVHSRMRTGFRVYEHLYPGADIILIEPSVEDQKMFFTNIFSFSNRHHVCEQAYQTTRQYLRTHAGVIAPKLARHGLRLRLNVLKQDKTLYGSLQPDPTSEARAVVGNARYTLDRLDALLHELNGQAVSD